MTRRLDTSGIGFYKARPLSWIVAGLLVLGAGAAHAEMTDGVQLPDRASKVGERRYRVPQDYENTLKYYKTVYPPQTHPRRPIVNQPGVKGVHIVNPDGKTWAGLNVYEANDEVRVYIVPADGIPGRGAKKKPDVKGKKKS